MLGIVFTGASGVGKSTLAKWSAQQFGLPLLPSVTTDVYRDFGTTFDAAMSDPDALLKIQNEIHKRTADRLNDQLTAGARRVGDMVHPAPNGFVTDRGPDVLVYTALMCNGAYPDGVPSDLDRVFKNPAVLVVFVRPCASILSKARATDERRRSLFLSDEWVYRVDGALAYHLESRNIPHITLEGSDARGRRATILRAVNGIRWREPDELIPVVGGTVVRRSRKGK